MAGLLVTYGPDIGWMYRQAGGYIGQILKGAKPAEMPVMQSIHFELVLNLKTAKRWALPFHKLSCCCRRSDRVIRSAAP